VWVRVVPFPRLCAQLFLEIRKNYHRNDISFETEHFINILLGNPFLVLKINIFDVLEQIGTPPVLTSFYTACPKPG
jgi:hypothetical protein